MLLENLTSEAYLIGHHEVLFSQIVARNMNTTHTASLSFQPSTVRHWTDMTLSLAHWRLCMEPQSTCQKGYMLPPQNDTSPNLFICGRVQYSFIAV